VALHAQRPAALVEVCQQTQRWVKARVIEDVVRDFERLAKTPAGLHFVAFAC
jgi:hypothetical protein